MEVRKFAVEARRSTRCGSKLTRAQATSVPACGLDLVQLGISNPLACSPVRMPYYAIHLAPKAGTAGVALLRPLITTRCDISYMIMPNVQGHSKRIPKRLPHAHMCLHFNQVIKRTSLPAVLHLAFVGMEEAAAAAAASSPDSVDPAMADTERRAMVEVDHLYHTSLQAAERLWAS